MGGVDGESVVFGGTVSAKEEAAAVGAAKTWTNSVRTTNQHRVRRTPRLALNANTSKLDVDASLVCPCPDILM